MPTLRNFATDHKSAAGYLDLAANTHGAEKGFLVHRALSRIQNTRAHVVEIGPGGGAAVSFLASQLAGEGAVQLTLIEAPGVVSESLTRATEEFAQAGGTCVLAHGFAQDIGTLLVDPVDVVSASALLHEVYSYGGGYSGLHAMMRTLPTVLRPNGFFVYRDVYAVKAPSLHERVIQSYDSLSWLLFLRMFVPQYLQDGTHPYHHFDDEMIVRQDSRIGLRVGLAVLRVHRCANRVVPGDSAALHHPPGPRVAGGAQQGPRALITPDTARSTRTLPAAPRRSGSWPFPAVEHGAGVSAEPTLVNVMSDQFDCDDGAAVDNARAERCQYNNVFGGHDTSWPGGNRMGANRGHPSPP